MSESTTSTVRTADLTKAQAKVLVALFGDLPDSKVLALVGRKGAKGNGVCVCGCGNTTGSEFAAGHDAQMKSLLNSLVNGTESTQINHRQFTKASAKVELAARGW